MKNRQEINEWLFKNWRKLASPCYSFYGDNNQNKQEEFENATLKVLVCFLSTGKTRSVSNTFNALYHNIKLAGDGVFADYCYYPEEVDKEVLKANDVPYMFGNVSHAPYTDYDLIMVSHSIVPEMLNFTSLYDGSDIPLTVEERLQKKDMPLVIYGGAAANESSMVLGPIYNEDGSYRGKSLVDICTYGYAENNLEHVVRFFKEWKESGKSCTKDKVELMDAMIDNKVQEGKVFYPLHYEWVYADDKFTIKEIKCTDNRLNKTIKYNRIDQEAADKGLGWSTKVFNLDGENSSSVDVQVSSGCSGQSSVCSFCMEATVAGNYYETDLPRVTKMMDDSIIDSAPNSISWYSYNVNYYGEFMNLLKAGAERFAGVSLLNERLDVVANSPEQLALAKYMGLKRFSGAVEGMGERVRDHIFNKNLSRETLMKAAEVVFGLKLMHFKFGMILCGQETKEDMDDFLDEIREMLEIRKRLGANTSLQMNFTPLVFYSQIALRYLPRITAENSFNEVRNMGYFLDEVKKLSEEYQVSIRTKVNGRGPGTYIEQLLLDFGPAGTQWMVDACREGLSYGRHFNNKDKEIVVKNLKKHGYEPLFFTFQRPEDWIFPNDHIDVITPEVKQMWIERTRAMDFSKRLCLKTPASKEPTCYKCKACEPKHIKFMLKRFLDDKATMQDVVDSLESNIIRDAIRVIVKKKPQYSMISNEMLSHTVTAQFFKQDNELAKYFHSVGKNSTSWVASNGQSDYFGGSFVYDIFVKSPISYKEFEKHIDAVNAQLETCQVVRVLGNQKEIKMNTNIYNAYLGTTTFSMSQIKDRLSNFDWMVGKAVKAMGGLDIEKVHMPELKNKVLFVPGPNGKTLVYMDLPAQFNPYIVMSSIMGKGYDKMLQECEFNVMDTTVEVDANCKCGNHLTYSLMEGKNKPVCPTCYGRLILKQLTKK